ncbi:MAG: response regulator [Pseudomonadota bacterium]
MARILVVDDEPDMLTLLKMIIEQRAGMEVEVTNHPLEALEILGRGQVDLMITDLKMPGMDGIELLGEAKRLDPDLVAMVITAYGSLESTEEAVSRGAFDFITKPFRKEQILLAVDRALRWRDMLRRNAELTLRLKKSVTPASILAGGHGPGQDTD